MGASFWSVFNKEFLHIVRDRGTLRIAFMIPVMQLILFGFIDQTVRNLPTVVVDQDKSTESRLLIEHMNASKTFKITRFTESPEEARSLIRAGRVRVAVLIPPKFHNHRLHDAQAQVLVLIDGSDSTASSQALASMNGLAAHDQSIKVVAQPLTGALAVQPIILFNPAGRTANYIIPGLIAIILQFVGILLAAGAIVREREKGTFEQLMVTPIHPLGLVLGKIGPYLLLSLFEMTFVLLLMRFVFDVPIRGNIGILYGAALLYLFALLSLGLLLSSRATTQMEAQQMAQMLVLPSIFLSGYIFPFEGMPAILRGIGSVLPATHMIAIMRAVVLRNASPSEIWPQLCALGVTAIALMWLSSRSVKKMTQ